MGLANAIHARVDRHKKRLAVHRGSVYNRATLRFLEGGRQMSRVALLTRCLIATVMAVGNTALLSANEGSEPEQGAVRVNPKDGLEYVWIPPGSFDMGCVPGDDDCYAEEQPAHRVTLAEGVWRCRRGGPGDA
jgi:formylglycine-generating enzyme required for sulfatase activity